MAVTVTAVKSTGQNTRTWDIIMDQDADVATLATAHGLTFTPTWWVLTPLDPVFFVGQYYLAAADVTATAFTLRKTNAAGSGSANAACRLTIGRLHTTMA